MRYALLIFFLLTSLASGQTKTVLKNLSNNSLTESFVVPSGASITIGSGASIINQGTATGFNPDSVPWSAITSKPTTVAGFGISDALTTTVAALTYQLKDEDLTNIAALTTTTFGRSLLTQANASAARTTLELGSLATQSGTLSDYLTTAVASSTYQLKDEDLTNIAALTTTTFGRSLLTQADATAARTTLGLGPLATQAEMQAGTVTAQRLMSPKLVADAIAALGGGSSIPVPVSIANGGTGSATPQAARVALGTETLVPGVAQVVGLIIESAPATEWNGRYIDIHDGTGVCRLWVNLVGGGTAPSTPSGGRLQEVAVSGFDIMAAETAFIAAFSAQSSAFTATGSAMGQITVTNVTAAQAAAPAQSSPALPISLSVATAGANSYRELPSMDGSQLTNISLGTPSSTILGGVYSSESSTGQFVKGLDTTGGLIYSALPTTAIANGGTGQTTAVAAFDALAPTTTKGDLIVHNGTDNIRVAVGGTNGHVLTVDSAQASGVKWAASSADIDGWERVQNATASSSASIIFDGIFSSGYEWRIRMQDIRPATGTTVLYLMPRAGGADLGTTETGRSLEVFSSVGSASTAARSATVGVIPIGSAFSNAFKNNFVFSWRPDTNTRSIVFEGSGSYNQSAATVSGYFSGTVGIASQPTGIKILFSSGNIAEGKFAVERRPISTIP